MDEWKKDEFGRRYRMIAAADQLRHLQMVCRPHGDRDIRDRPVDGVLRAGEGAVAVYDLTVELVRGEVFEPVVRNEPAQPPALVEQLELRPEIHQTVAGRSAREPDDASDLRPDLHQRPEAFCLGILEGRQLVYDDGIEVKGHSTFFDKPLHVFPVDQVDVRLPEKGAFSFGLRADDYGVFQIPQMIPLFDLAAPCISGDSQRGYDQDPVGFKAVEQKFPQGRQGDDGLVSRGPYPAERQRRDATRCIRWRNAGSHAV